MRIKLEWRQWQLSIMSLIFMVIFSGCSQPSQTGYIISDNFESYPLDTWSQGTTHGNWYVQYNGYGNIGIESDDNNVFFEKPMASTRINESHAAQIISTRQFGDFNATLKLRTLKQLRTNTDPNPWEVAWVLWHFTDNTHFYYLILKPNGWELGKEDPAYPGAQRFLDAASSPTYPIGKWYDVQIQQHGATFTVWANGRNLTTFTDTERPYLSGSLGLYTEDAWVHFDDVLVTNLKIPTPNKNIK